MSKAKRPLPSRLTQPIPLRAADDKHRTVLTGRADYLDVPRVLKETRERMDLLFTHYGIENNDDCDAWRSLAVRLALDYVPGLKVNKVGRKRSTKDLIEQFEDVRRSWKNGKPSEGQIADVMAKRTGVSASTVLRRYHEQKARVMSPRDEARLIAEMTMRGWRGRK